MGHVSSPAGRSAAVELRVSTPAEMIVDEQIDAYNAHDVERFLRCYTDQPTMHRLGGEQLLGSREEFRERYAHLFAAHPGIRATIVKRVACGGVVVDLEQLEGLTNETRAPLVVIYEIAGGLISRVWVARDAG